MKSGYGSFSVEIPVGDDEKMDAFQKAMDDYHDELNKLIEVEAKKLGISDLDMGDIYYLRTRSRWTQEKENYLIKLAREGKPLPPTCEDFVVPEE